MNPLTPYLGLIKVAAVVLALAALAWAANAFLDHEQQIGYDRAKAEYMVKLEAAQEAARAKETQLNQRIQEAQHAAAEREKTLRADADAARTAADGLRDTLGNIRRRLSAAPIDACRATADATLAVLGQCQDQYRAVAEAADGHASDAQTLSEAWPR